MAANLGPPHVKDARPPRRLAHGHLRILRRVAFGPSHAFREVDRYRFKGEIKMLGMGLLGTIIVIALIVWLVRRVA